jgi:hypothetical protein
MLWHLHMEPGLLLAPYFPDLTDPSERVGFQTPKKVPNPEREERIRAHLEMDRLEHEEQDLASREWVAQKQREEAEEKRREIVRLCEREIREHRIATHIEVPVKKALSKSEQWDRVDAATTPSPSYRIQERISLPNGLQDTRVLSVSRDLRALSKTKKERTLEQWLADLDSEEGSELESPEVDPVWLMEREYTRRLWQR